MYCSKCHLGSALALQEPLGQIHLATCLAGFGSLPFQIVAFHLGEDYPYPAAIHAFAVAIALDWAFAAPNSYEA